jgi:hypothetical protein
MTYNPTRCKDCDTLLWSAYAKELGLCPECENVDESPATDLETAFEEATK